MFTIISVEFTLHFNHVAGVADGSDLASAGQLIALLIGIISTIRICWIVCKESGKEGDVNAAGSKPTIKKVLEGALAFREILAIERGQLARAALDTYLPWLNCFPFWARSAPRQTDEVVSVEEVHITIGKEC